MMQFVVDHIPFLKQDDIVSAIHAFSVCSILQGRLDDQYVIRIMRDKLKSKLCRNQGFVLDSFPKTYEQAKDLFYGETEMYPHYWKYVTMAAAQ